MDDTYMIVLEHGSFYYPASKRYGNDDDVACDRCGRVNIESCVGYGNYDLCMICVDNLLNKVSVPPVPSAPPVPLKPDDSKIDEEISYLMEWLNHSEASKTQAPKYMERTRMHQRFFK